VVRAHFSRLSSLQASFRFFLRALAGMNRLLALTRRSDRTIGVVARRLIGLKRLLRAIRFQEDSITTGSGKGRDASLKKSEFRRSGKTREVQREPPPMNHCRRGKIERQVHAVSCASLWHRFCPWRYFALGPVLWPEAAAKPPQKTNRQVSTATPVNATPQTLRARHAVLQRFPRRYCAGLSFRHRLEDRSIVVENSLYRVDFPIAARY